MRFAAHGRLVFLLFLYEERGQGTRHRVRGNWGDGLLKELGRDGGTGDGAGGEGR